MERYTPSRERFATLVVYAIFALTGVAVELPGTLLPLLAARWHLNDAASGTVLLALFLGSSLGSLLARNRLARPLVGGCVLSGAALLLLLTGHAVALAAGLYGLGLGTAMTSISLLQSRRVPGQRTREMAALNLTWGVGALAGPLLLLRGSARFSLQHVLVGFAGTLFLAALMAAATVSHVSIPCAPQARYGNGLRAVPLPFFLLLPLATGIESGTASWLSTYSTRAGHVLNGTIGTLTAFWAGFLLSRLLSTVRRLATFSRARLLQLSGLLLAGMVVLLLHWAAWTDSAGAFLVGSGVGPLFPLLLAQQLEFGEAGNAGFLAAGMGSAVLPMLTGAVSQETGTLRGGMGVLLLAAILIALLGWRLTGSVPGPVERGMRRAAGLLLDALAQVFASLARLTVVSLFAITFLLQPSQIPTGSMVPTMLVGDFVLVNKQVFAPKGHWGWLLPYRDPLHDDVIVFHYPVDPGELLVKRVIAEPGDRVHLHRGAVVLNGQTLAEPFAAYSPTEPSAYRDEFPTLERADPSVEAAWWIELRRRMRHGELPVPPGEYFVMGDNRNNSQDSRFWGFVPRDAVLGEPILVYLSVDRTAATPRGRLRGDRMLRVVR